MINCTVCGKLLLGKLDTFGESGQEFCWEHYAALLIEGEEELADREAIRKEHEGKCPGCGADLSVGVSEISVGRTCPNCGYHDFTSLFAVD